VREVGRGGMGVVYEAEQMSLGRFVALKLLPAQLTATGRERERFLREAKTAAKLHHTNIVPVFGFGEADGTPYYAMQFIRGQGLDAVIDELKGQAAGAHAAYGDSTVTRAANLARSLVTGDFASPEAADATGTFAPACEPLQRPGPLPKPGAETVARADTGVPSRVAQSGVAPAHRARPSRDTLMHGIARIGVQVAQALDHAHAQGVLHRDIKPSNLLLDAYGNTWVTDFGLAKAEGLPELTRAGDVLGTLRYMPPEAFEGAFDARGDVYALGLTLYELLALRPAFDESDRRKLLKLVCESAPPPLRKVAPHVPRDLATIVHKAIQRDPARRYQTAAALAEDLQRFLDDRPIAARPVSALEHGWRACRRNPVLSGMGAAALCGLVVGLVGALWGRAVAKEQEADATFQKGRAEQNEKTAQKNAVAAERAADDLRAERDVVRAVKNQLADRLYLSDMHRAKLNWDGGNPAVVRELVAAHAPRPDEPDRRGFEWYYWNRLANRTSRAIRCDLPWIKRLQFHPRGDLIVAGGGGEPVHLYATGGGPPLRTFEPPKGAVLGPTLFTADGEHLLIAEVGETESVLQFWNLRAQKFDKALAVKARLQSLATDTAGKYVVAGTYGGPVRIWDGKTWEERPAWVGHTTYVTGTGITPDGTRAATTTYDDRTVRLWDVATGKALAVARADAGFEPRGAWNLALRPDGKQAVASNQILWAWDLTRDPPRIVWQSRAHAAAVAYTPDGARLVAVCADAVVRVFDSATGAELAALRGHANDLSAVAVSSDGKTVASAGRDRSIRIWNLDNAADSRTVVRAERAMMGAAVSPDGAVLVAAEYNGRAPGVVRVVDRASGRERAVFTAHASGVNHVRFVPNTDTVATDGRDGVVRLWDARALAAGQPPVPVKEFKLHLANNGVCDVRFRPDGKQMATCGWDQTLKLTDVATGTVARTIKTPGWMNWTVAYRPDGKVVAVESEIHGADNGSSVVTYDAETGRELYRLADNPPAGQKPRRKFSRPLFGPDGKTLFAATDDEEIAVRAFDAATGAPLGPTFRGHTGRITAMAVTNDGRRLLTASMDGTARLWDVASGLELLAMRHPGGTV